MISACRESGVQLCYGASYRYLPALIAAREIILSGQLGEILLLRESCIGGSGSQNRQTLGPHHFPPGGPGGSSMGLIDHGIHLIDTFSWLMDAPCAGRSDAATFPRHHKVPNSWSWNSTTAQSDTCCTRTERTRPSFRSKARSRGAVDGTPMESLHLENGRRFRDPSMYMAPQELCGFNITRITCTG